MLILLHVWVCMEEFGSEGSYAEFEFLEISQGKEYVFQNIF